MLKTDEHDDPLDPVEEIGDPLLDDAYDPPPPPDPDPNPPSLDRAFEAFWRLITSTNPEVRDAECYHHRKVSFDLHGRTLTLSRKPFFSVDPRAVPLVLRIEGEGWAMTRYLPVGRPDHPAEIEGDLGRMETDWVMATLDDRAR